MSTLKKILINKDSSCKSVWFMRQAGRYLPEFQKIRSKNKNFIKLCLNSELSSEITLQPIKRFDLDSAIIFSDILLTPYAFGQKVKFIKNLGPKLDNFKLEKFLNVRESEFLEKLEPVYKAIKITKKNLGRNKSLIGFIGAPWTLLVYMLDIKKGKKEISLNKLKKFEKEIEKILSKLIKFLCLHIENQFNAGADVIQIFDSWAGLIPSKNIREYCYEPNAKIVNFCKKNNIPNICFPRGIKEKFKNFNKIVKPDGINIDYEIKPEWVLKNLKNVVIQGGLNPKMLLENEAKMIKGATKYIKTFKGIPYIFNLGHGLLPETDPDKVKKLIELYRKY
tara:strand:- start:341 stop:1348 length:1008 start_codon:yes stop_codon:yes gene_type:complete